MKNRKLKNMSKMRKALLLRLINDSINAFKNGLLTTFFALLIVPVVDSRVYSGTFTLAYLIEFVTSFVGEYCAKHIRVTEKITIPFCCFYDLLEIILLLFTLFYNRELAPFYLFVSFLPFLFYRPFMKYRFHKTLSYFGGSKKRSQNLNTFGDRSSRCRGLFSFLGAFSGWLFFQFTDTESAILLCGSFYCVIRSFDFIFNIVEVRALKRV